MALKKIFPQEVFPFWDFIKLFPLNTFSDYVHAHQARLLMKNVFQIPAMRFLQFWGTYRGHASQKPLTSDLKQKFYYPRRPGIFRKDINGRP
jgi:hypothetical protein